jgi:hypothetical protein
MTRSTWLWLAVGLTAAALAATFIFVPTREVAIVPTGPAPTPFAWRARLELLAGDGVAGLREGAALQARFADPYGMLSLLATENGVISNIDASVGGFVASGQPLATINRGEGMFVSAEFRLEPYNFARVQEGARVEIILPDHTRIDGEVSEISVTTVDGQADADVTIASEGLVMGAAGGLVASGTPVTAILHLKEEGPLAGVKSAWLQFLEQIGV